MKWLIVEDGLSNRKGHWLEYVSTFVRGLKELGDEVVVLCDRKAEGFVREQTGALPVMPESIWHRMGDGAGSVKRYMRVPGHAWTTFVAMRRVLKEFNHNRAHGVVRERATKGWPEGQGSGDERVNGYREHRVGVDKKLESECKTARMEAAQVNAQRTCAGASETNSLTSRLVELSVSGSPIRFPNGAACLPAISYALPANSSSPDWIFVPTVLVHHLLGWWLLLKTGSVPRESRVLLFFPNLPIRLDDAGKAHWNGGPTIKLMAWLFTSFTKEVESGRVVLGVETHAMRRALEGLIGIQVTYLPHPVDAKPGWKESRNDSGEKSSKREDVLTTEDTEGEQGRARETCDGPEFLNPSTSELAQDSENTALIRSADAPSSSPVTTHSLLSTTPEASLPATRYPPPATSAKPIVFGCYGPARWEKGSDIFQEAIKLILKNEVASGDCPVASIQSEGASELAPSFLPVTSNSRPTRATGGALRFAIQWVQDFQDEKGNLVQLDPWLKNHPQVEVVGRYFQGDEYDKQLERTDVMVLPYRSPYRLRVSRVVVEAMMNGIPVIATRGTTLFDQADEYGVVVGCGEGSAESLAEAILEITKCFEKMRVSAIERATTAVESFSVEYFRDLLAKNEKNH
jgi:glycosyltransferase involved in cell wall biosynthesis